MIDTKDNMVAATIAAPHMTFTALAATRKGHKMLAVNSVLLPLTANSTVEVIDTETNTIDDSITVERFPLSIATQPPRARRDGDDHGDDD